MNDRRARYYTPSIGRFLFEDPAGFAGSGPHLYDDPIDSKGPLGLLSAQTFMNTSLIVLPISLIRAAKMQSAKPGMLNARTDMRYR